MKSSECGQSVDQNENDTVHVQCVERKGKQHEIDPLDHRIMISCCHPKMVVTKRFRAIGRRHDHRGDQIDNEREQHRAGNGYYIRTDSSMP